MGVNKAGEGRRALGKGGALSKEVGLGAKQVSLQRGKEQPMRAVIDKSVLSALTYFHLPG